MNILHNNKIIGIGTSLTYIFHGFSVISKPENWREVVALFEYVGITNENIRWVADSLKTKKYVIRRMDDNGIEFDVETFDNPINASLKLSEYDSGIHKQTYWLEERPDKVSNF